MQLALAIVAIMAGSLVSMMFLLVLLAMLALAGAAGYTAYKLMKNENNHPPQHVQLYQQQQQPQQYLTYPHGQPMQHQYLVPAPSGMPSPAPSTQADAAAAAAISFDRVREASMAIVEKRDSLTSPHLSGGGGAGFYTRAEQNLDRVVDPSKSRTSVVDTVRSSRTNSAAIRSRTGSETAGGRLSSGTPPTSKPGSMKGMMRKTPPPPPPSSPLNLPYCSSPTNAAPLPLPQMPHRCFLVSKGQLCFR